MFEETQYQLLDFGNGRKLEKFGDHIIDRPSPAAEEFFKQAPKLWEKPTLRFDKQGQQDGNWIPKHLIGDKWSITHGEIELELRPTPAGHLGVFAEQAENWDWIATQVRRCERQVPARRA